MKRIISIISVMVFACISVFAEGDGEKDNLIPVMLNDKWGYIDRTGKFVVEPQFDRVFWFTENGWALIERNGKSGYIDRTGKIIISPQFDKVYCFAENGLAVVELNSKLG